MTSSAHKTPNRNAMYLLSFAVIVVAVTITTTASTTTITITARSLFRGASRRTSAAVHGRGVKDPLSPPSRSNVAPARRVGGRVGRTTDQCRGIVLSEGVPEAWWWWRPVVAVVICWRICSSFG